ncbi:MAG TPA: hypothetical protein DCP63_14625 [Bacteroidetes bacterium]|nr:hypothetical protein [Bacteroidota bacterium]
MDRYLIVSPHTVEECKKAIHQVHALGYITHFDWGCAVGDHTGWAIIEADSEAEALLVVPSFERPKARAVRLKKFSPEEVRGMHAAS